MTDFIRRAEYGGECGRYAMTSIMAPQPSILLFGQDKRLVETRQWVLEKSGFRVHTALSLLDLQRIGVQEPIELFLLCDSLLPETRTQALALIHCGWPRAKRLVLASVSSIAELEPTEEVFPAMEGPSKLVMAIRTLIVNGPVSAP